MPADEPLLAELLIPTQRVARLDSPVVIRKIDGVEILRRVQQHGVTVMCAAPAVAAAVLEAAQTWEG